MTILKSSMFDLPPEVVSKMNNSDVGFFGSFRWFENFVKNVAKSMKVEASVYFDQQNLSVILPLMSTTDGSLRVIKSLSNYYSPIFSIVHSDSIAESDSVVEFFLALKKQLPVWDLMELRPLAYEETSSLLTIFKKAGLPTISFFCFGNWYLNLNGRSFNDYFTGLSSKLKNTVNRKSKKFFQLKGARVEIITSEAGLLEGTSAYQNVYNSSWKVEEPFPEFMPGLLKVASSIGGLRLGIAYLEDKTIAAQFWIVADNTAYIFKLAYDEEYKQYSAGTILTTKLMEHVIDIDKVEVVDYLCGDDSYKKDWMSSRRERWGILVFNTATFNGMLEYVKELSKFYIKRLMSYFGNTSVNSI